MTADLIHDIMQKEFIYTTGSYWNHGLIRAAYAENIGIIGEKGASIDGSNVYDPEGEERYCGPHAINMHRCKNVIFDGYTVQNSSNWAHAIFFSEDVTFRNLSVWGGHDAIHTRVCSNVKISDCTLCTGDDCIAGCDNIDVTVRNCDISSACSAFRFGGYNILVENGYHLRSLQISIPRHLFHGRKNRRGTDLQRCAEQYAELLDKLCHQRSARQKAGGKAPYPQLHGEQRRSPAPLNLSGNEPWQVGTPPTDIIFENIKAENIKMGLTVYGLEGCPLTLTMKNVDYSFREGSEETPMMRIAHCGEINLENVTVTGYRGTSLIRSWSKGSQLNISNLQCDLNGGQLLASADEKFVCTPI